MTILKICTIAIALLFARGISHANPDKLRSEIEAVNEKIERLFISEDAPSLTKLYSDEMTFFAEYQPAIFDRQQLEEFFTSWFKVSDVKSYKKKIYEVRSISNHILEIGTFSTEFNPASGPPQQFNAKYMILWIRDDKGKLRIRSEAFGALQYVDPSALPYSGVRVDKREFVARHNVSQDLQTEIEEYNAKVIKAVAEGDSEVRAKGYSDDAISMPPFGPLQVGMPAIREHMQKTYHPGISFIVKHTYSRIYELGDYVFINGHYAGTWGDSNNGGKFDGNMSNLMKRTDEGKLIMYRSLGNREY